MRITAKQSTTETLTDLFRALDHQFCITLTYTDEHGETTIRTVELHELRTNGDGGIELVVMCRLRRAERNLLLSGVSEYTVHRMAYVLTRPEPTKFERHEPQPSDDAQALFLHELARDRDDADYRPRKLIQTDTDLAA